MKFLLFKLLILFYLTLISALFANDKKKKSIKSHEHGVGILNLSQDENILLIEFEVPGSDIVGFEYKAKSEEDIKKVKDAVNILSDYRNILLPSSSAECELEDSSVKVMNEGEHSEFLTSYKFNCSNISSLRMIYIKYFKVFPDCYKTNIKIFGKNKKSAYVINNSKKFITVKGHF